MMDGPKIDEAPAGAAIDWTEIRRRVDTARQQVTAGAELTPEAARAILEERARTLARESDEVDDTQDELDIVEFILATETYGMASRWVREVYPLRDLTPLPGTPPFVLGLVNVRGHVLSVVDLKRFFHLPEKGLGDLNNLIILRNERMEFGILADAILGSRPVPMEGLQTAPPTVTGIGADYLMGVTAEGTIVLDGAKILGDEKMIVNQELGARN